MVSLLSVQWPLKADNPEKLLLAADELREKIKAADLAGGNDAPKLSPEEQEVAEEMAAEQSRQSNEEATAPNEPRFVFVARLTAAERQKALAEAFAKARVQAAELAKAAGMELGSLASLSGEGGGNAGGLSPYVRAPWGGYSRNEEYDMVQQTIAANGGGEEQRNESLARSPTARASILGCRRRSRYDSIRGGESRCAPNTARDSITNSNSSVRSVNWKGAVGCGAAGASVRWASEPVRFLGTDSEVHPANGSQDRF